MINLVTMSAKDPDTVSAFVTQMVQGERRPFPPVPNTFVVFLPGG